MDAPDLKELLAAASRGDAGASGGLIRAVHSELHRMAEGKLRGERPGHTLQPTALVNEVYLRLFFRPGTRLEDRAHFFGAAARAMELVLVDHARRKRAEKRGGRAARVTLQGIDVASPAAHLDVIEVHESLEALDRESPELAGLVRLRYFVGMTLEEIARNEGVSLATVKRRWTFARAWLYERLGD